MTSLGSSDYSNVLLAGFAILGATALSSLLGWSRCNDFVVFVNLQLTATASSEIHIKSAIRIFKNGWVNAATAFNCIFLGFERALEKFADRHANFKKIVLVLGRKIQIIATIFISTLRCSKLFFGPRNSR